jgi:leucyl-tRNA synthetase
LAAAWKKAKVPTTQETGYKHIKFSARTASPIHHHYYAHSKGAARAIEAHGLLFDLVDDERDEPKLESDEQGKFKIEWLPVSEIESKVTDELHTLVYDLLARGENYHGEGIMANSGVYDGLPSSEAREKIIEDLAKKSVAKFRTNYKIRDWLISRQRYWGAPIPIVHCAKDGAVAVPDKDLPVELPVMQSYESSGDGRSPLARVPEWVNTTCPKCGGPAQRETDTMDGFACSSWYFLRFADPRNNTAPFDAKKAEYWLPVDTYIGGAEHAVMHLLYARFWTKVMYDAGLIKFGEPFTALRNHGMILAPDGRKMSKSWGNVIAPDDLIADGYGADCIRVMEMFIGPWNQKANWSIEGVGGCFRFLQRAWAVSQEYLEGEGNAVNAEQEAALNRATNATIKAVTKDLEEMGFNTAVASLMEFVNTLYKIKIVFPPAKQNDAWRQAITALVQLLAPYAPHLAEELWHELGNEDSVHVSAWPVWEETALRQDTMTIVVQVNGKVRAKLDMPVNAGQADIEATAMADTNVRQYVNGSPKKVIYVPGKILNIVA